MKLISELQTIANQYADIWMKDETLYFGLIDAEQKKYNAKEWYIITNLAQVYANVKSNVISRRDGLEEQRLVPLDAGRYIRFCGS